jgi:UDP-N-acetylglucosamine--N-acetylmuramyl-(pentapeptide) pyrophosphoryl-undecaprenol N-acetylglucosamine transferase
MGGSTTKGVVIAAGGTGGHIIPAIAIGEALGRLAPGTPVSFLCGSKPIEGEIYQQFGISPVRLAAVPIYRKLVAKIRGAIRLVRSFFQSIAFIRRHGKVVLGMGSYVAAPVMAAARILGVPLYIHEQNSIPGKTNRMFSKQAQRFFCSFPITEQKLKGCKTEVVGVPVRSAILQDVRDEAREFFNIPGDGVVLLVLGGSQGARYLNEIVVEILSTLDAMDSTTGENISVIWSTGTAHFKHYKEKVEERGLKNITVRMYPFIERMEMAYALSNLAICRAGASTLAEISIRGIPALMVPLPGAKDNHQYYNARHYSDSGAGLIFEQKNLNAVIVAETIASLMVDRDRLQEMRAASLQIAQPNAAEQVAGELVDAIKNFS